MSIQEQFEKFYENIKLTLAQREDAVTKYTGVCKKLHDFYYPDLEYNGSTKLLIGSYGKHTHIRPARDIDVIFIMPPEKFDQYNDNQSNKQSQLLQDVKCILEEKYPDTPIKAFGKVVVLEFADTKHDVELLPAWENDSGTFTIPNSENGGSWEQWDPRAEMQRIADSDSETGRTRMLIRMIKKWSENCTAKLKSYQIENKVVEFFTSGDFAETELSTLAKEFFSHFHLTTTDTDLKSHLSTALSRATKACEFEEDDDLEKSVEEWRKVFGDDFPATLKKTLLVTDIKPALSDYSHYEPLRWNFVETAKVSIDAYIYDDTKTKRLGGVNSDGRNLSAGFNLKYVAQTNTKGYFEYYWQVVNTGEEAKKAGGLRGNIFSHGQTRWESTLYPGKHWIECFIVQNGTCVARSGKFFVNIK
ncbi:MAG: hypothetical protein M1383_05265 [Patescibacteria group bacterium]|nr:hypothetical protein [Patescibacteria group bacterium]